MGRGGAGSEEHPGSSYEDRTAAPFSRNRDGLPEPRPLSFLAPPGMDLLPDKFAPEEFLVEGSVRRLARAMRDHTRRRLGARRRAGQGGWAVWVRIEFESVDSGDKRPKARLVRVLERFCQQLHIACCVTLNSRQRKGISRTKRRCAPASSASILRPPTCSSVDVVSTMPLRRLTLAIPPDSPQNSLWILSSLVPPGTHLWVRLSPRSRGQGRRQIG
jgi:hypothetical protein